MYKTLLYVEDEEQIAEIYATVLRDNGYQVDLAFDGKSGLERAQSNPYDVILLDLMLPALSGSDILRILRDAHKSPSFNQQTDIVMLTNFDVDDYEKQEILKLAQAYLIKVNASPKQLVGILQEMWDKKQTAPAESE